MSCVDQEDCRVSGTRQTVTGKEGYRGSGVGATGEVTGRGAFG